MLAMDQVGGGEAKRHFTWGGRAVRPGDRFTRDELLAIPFANLQSLVDTDKLAVHPRVIPSNDLHIVSTGFGHFSVLQGAILADKLSKDEAAALVAELTGEDPPETPPAN